MLHLIDNFYLDADDRQYILTEWNGKDVNKSGSPHPSDYWYIQKLPDVFVHLAEILTRRKIGTLKDVSEIALTVKNENDRVFALFERVLSASLASSDGVSARIRGDHGAWGTKVG